MRQKELEIHETIGVFCRDGPTTLRLRQDKNQQFSSWGGKRKGADLKASSNLSLEVATGRGNGKLLAGTRHCKTRGGKNEGRKKPLDTREGKKILKAAANGCEELTTFSGDQRNSFDKQPQKLTAF